MEGRLQNRVALVTGASRGIGEAIARRCAREGARVVNGSIVAPEHDDVSGIEYRPLDVTDEASVRQVVIDLVGRHGRLDMLVNNAGVEVETDVVATSVEDWDRVMAVNVRGPFLCSRQAIPHLSRTRGVIINLASVNAFWAEPNLAAYSASKAAVLQLTRCMALDHASQGIRCVAICPGYVRTAMLERFYDHQPDPDGARRALTGRHPLGRICEVDEVAALAAWLACDEAGFATGQPFVIDGGLSAGRVFDWAAS